MTPERRLEINLAALEKIAVEAEIDRQLHEASFTIPKEYTDGRSFSLKELYPLFSTLHNFAWTLIDDKLRAARPGHARYRLPAE